MTQQLRLLLCALGLALVQAIAQAPTGTIAGIVHDETGAVIPNVAVSVTNKSTGAARALLTSADGTYSAPSLAAGAYEVRAQAPGFRALLREATVETGNTTTVEMRMEVGATSEVVNVEAAASQISYDSHQIDGVVTRQKIEACP